MNKHGKARFLILTSCFSILTSQFGCGPTSFLITPVPASRELEEHVVSRDSFFSSTKIALIEVDGVISNARSTSILGTGADNPVSVFKEKLDRAAHDKAVKGIVLRINSPGGGVTASDLMYGEVKRFKEKTGKRVVASMLDVAASGGYYVACGADKIYAHPTTVTGSIGVIMMLPDLTGTMQKLGVRTNVIKSGEMKDSGSPFREMNERDRAYFQTMINAMYERFLDVVAASRTGLDREKIRQLADGRVYLAGDAKANGLVDEIGTLRDAIHEAAPAGTYPEGIIVVEYALPLSHRPNVYAAAPESPGQVNVINVELPEWLRGTSPQFLYLWAPGW